jgi:F-type H+-transporting ATPase subunit gamma
MNTIREIRRRIRSIAGTAQITRAMQMVAASKMRRAQQSALTAGPFARTLYGLQLNAIRLAGGDFTHPLLEVRATRKRAVIVISADKGLCGILNANIFRVAGEFDAESTVFITAGRKAAQFIARTGRQLAADFPYGDPPRFAEARAVASFARDLFLAQGVDEVRLVTSRFVNTLTQQAVTLEFLPVGEITGLKIPTLEPLAEPGAGGECLFEPSAEAVLGYVLPIFLNISVYFAMLHARASEHSARMVSMQGATDSAEKLIGELTLAANKLRQESITTELLEIAGGQSG